MQFGCVYFDDYGTEGWASIAGATPLRITGTQDLSTNVLWITNLDWEGMRAKSIQQHPRFRMDNFLRIKLSSLAIELDIRNDGDVEQRVQVLAEIIDRVCRLSQSIFGITHFLDDLPSSLRASILSEKDARSYGSPIVDYAIKDAIQSWQRCETISPQGTNFYTWRFPRLDYAEYLLGFIIPTSKWKRIKFDDEQDVKQYINENLDFKPMLCKIIVKRVKDSTFAQIMPFGYGANRQRTWATGQEVLHYMRYADVEVTSLLAADDYRELNLRLPDFSSMTGKISISMGVLAECCWRALSSKSSPRAAWYSSWDRISCCKTAMVLAEAGISVKSYGSGALTLAVHPSQYQYVFDQCIKAGLTPPLNMVSHMDSV